MAEMHVTWHKQSFWLNQSGNSETLPQVKKMVISSNLKKLHLKLVLTTMLHNKLRHWAVRKKNSILHTVAPVPWGKKCDSDHQTHDLVPDHPPAQSSSSKPEHLFKTNKAVAYASVQQKTRSSPPEAQLN